MKKEKKKSSKKPYDRPKLVIYGDIIKITQGGGPLGATDSPSFMSH